LDIPSESMQDPQWHRGEGKLKSRDGCRVPLPWTSQGSSFGFGAGGSHLPQPAWFSELSVESQQQGDTTLNLYRRAINLRKKMLKSEDINWLKSEPGTISFERDGLICITNFGEEEISLPAANLLISSAPLSAGKLRQ